MHITRSLATFAVAMMSVFGGTGCIKSMLLNGQIESTRKASSAVDTVQDYEVARSVAYAGLAQFEGMHKLAPKNKDALFMLTKGWSGAAAAFIEDDMEIAEDLKERDTAEYHKQRGIAAYERAINYGLEYLALDASGFEAATKNDSTMRSWLKENFDDKEDAQILLWLGYSWIARVNLAKEDPEMVAKLWIGVAIVERSVELDREYAYGTGLTILAAYHARTAQAELADSEKLFQEVASITGGNALLPKFNHATKLLCAKADKDGYEKELKAIVDAGDVMPLQRLQNAIAKRKAKRYLGKARMNEMRENCAFQ
ncbi:MAG: TRAP transporter TatT component family protein [Polyangiaceae bacterium]